MDMADAKVIYCVTQDWYLHSRVTDEPAPRYAETVAECEELLSSTIEEYARSMTGYRLSFGDSGRDPDEVMAESRNWAKSHVHVTACLGVHIGTHWCIVGRLGDAI